MSNYSIKDLEHLSGIKAHTIRMWEQRYELFSPKRTSTNIRLYQDEDLKLILQISSLQQFGLKISKIVAMTWKERQETVRRLSISHDSFDQLTNALTVSMLDLDEIYFDKIVSSTIIKIGFERTMIEVLYPFLNRIGILWMTGSINPAHEHFVSHLIREKLISATTHLKPAKNGPLFSLILPEAELHELGLLFARYILKARRIRTLFLGQVVPINSLKEINDKVEINYLLICITTNPSADDVQDYINDVSKKFSATEVFITGPQVIDVELILPSNIRIIKTFEAFISVIDNEIKMTE